MTNCIRCCVKTAPLTLVGNFDNRMNQFEDRITYFPRHVVKSLVHHRTQILHTRAFELVNEQRLIWSQKVFDRCLYELQ